MPHMKSSMHTLYGGTLMVFLPFGSSELFPYTDSPGPLVAI